MLSPVTGKMEDGDKNDTGASTLVRAMASTFVLTITNPATLLAFASMFAELRRAGGRGGNSYVDAGFVVAGRGGRLGRLVAGPDHRDRPFPRPHHDAHGARSSIAVSGVLVAIFGLAVLIHVVMKVLGLGQLHRQKLPRILRFFRAIALCSGAAGPR